jgi:hypothetical protein
VLTAGSIWPDCRLETNLFCWTRQSGVVGRQLGRRIGFNVATVVNEKVIDFYFLVWCMPRQSWFAVLCRFWLQCSHGLRRGSWAAWLLESRVRIPLREWMLVSVYMLLSCVCRDLCNRLITRPDESYRVSNCL